MLKFKPLLLFEEEGGRAYCFAAVMCLGLNKRLLFKYLEKSFPYSYLTPPPFCGPTLLRRTMI